MAAKDIIKHGLAWRVGDSLRINIWSKNWLPFAVSPNSPLQCLGWIQERFDKLTYFARWEKLERCATSTPIFR